MTETNGAIPLTAFRASDPDTFLVPLRCRIRRRRQWEQRVLIDRHQRIDQGRVEQLVIFVRGEKERAIAAVDDLWNYDRATQSEAGILLLQWETLEAERVVLPGVRVQRFIRKKNSRARETCSNHRACADSPARPTRGHTQRQTDCE